MVPADQYPAASGSFFAVVSMAEPLSIGLAYLAWGGYGPILLAPAILSALAVLSADRALRAKVSAPSPG